jgi:hypothetical protein
VIISADFEVKSLEAAEKGELVSFPFGNGDALAIVLARFESGTAGYGILRAPSEFPQAPFHIKLEPDGHCLSFGLDWEIKLIRGPQTYNRNRDFHERPEAIHITEDAAIMTFDRPPKISAERLHFDLKTLRARSPQNHAVPVLNWKIWRRTGMTLNPMAQPIFSFSLAA